MDKGRLLNQLRRIEGQVRGISRMVEADRGLVATMQQLMAAEASLRKLRREYAKLFLQSDELGRVVLTPEQTEYILDLLN